MPLVAFSIKLDRIDESLLYRYPGGGFWLSERSARSIWTPKGRMVVAQSIPKERLGRRREGAGRANSFCRH